MKHINIVLMALAVGLGAAFIYAQDVQQPAGQQPPQRDEQDFPPPMHGHRPPPPPVMVVLDANHDGKIDAQEILNAANALKQLDKNGDGELTFEELRPPFPPPGFAPPDEDFDPEQEPHGPRGDRLEQDDFVVPPRCPYHGQDQ